jgi:hypothetical protein
MFADALLELGDQIDLNEWEAIENEYNVDSNITETALNMSSLQLAYALVHLRNVQANKIPNFQD